MPSNKGEQKEDSGVFTENPVRNRGVLSRLFSWVFEPNHPFRQILAVIALVVGLAVGSWQLYELATNFDQAKDEDPQTVVPRPEVEWQLYGLENYNISMAGRPPPGPFFFQGDAIRYQQMSTIFEDQCADVDSLSRIRKIECESGMRASTSMIEGYSTLLTLICMMQTDIDDLDRTNSLADWESDRELTKERSEKLAKSLQYSYHQFQTTKEELYSEFLPGSSLPEETFYIFFSHADELRGGVEDGLHLSGERPARLNDDFRDWRDQIDVMKKAITSPLRKLCSAVIYGAQ